MRSLYDLTASRLFAIILRVTSDRNAAEDILQETYIKVWNKAGSFREGRAEPFAWLATIARNGAIDWRKAHYQRKFSTSDDFEHIEDEAETAEDRIERYQQQAIIAEALSNLSKDREIEIRDVFFAGLTYTELAERADIPVATVKSRVRRTLIHLRSRLNND
jgi:RNA polymerase sigma factor (sigma-70 family)